MLSSDPMKKSGPLEKTCGHAADIAGWLGLAATPTFAMMAFLTASRGGADMVCASAQGVFTLDGMVTMYLIMSAFHLPPWLRLISRHGIF
ncbi:MAG: hypothetical protein AAAB35_02160 [Phyllobacterium sp.]|uniref:hypothetical protein n=1 Tax=Phyllobacterium sp. TaxID=1871046 RepID=UPI0030F1130A